MRILGLDPEDGLRNLALQQVCVGGRAPKPGAAGGRPPYLLCRCLVGVNQPYYVLSQTPPPLLPPTSWLQVPSTPCSALFLHSAAVDGGGPVGGASEAGGLFLHVGLENGVLTRTEVDRVTGQVRGRGGHCEGLWEADGKKVGGRHPAPLVLTPVLSEREFVD